MRTPSTNRPTRGSALLTVLWLSAALAAIALSLSTTVRGETDRTSTSIDGLRSYYLAVGAVERAYIELLWSVTLPADQRPIPQGASFIDYAFPTGAAHVEIVPETSKFDVNTIAIQDLYRLAMALGLDPDRAHEIAAAIDDWRKPIVQGSPFDPFYLSQVPSFRARHASIEEIEELLLVKGVTPEIFYGTYVPAPVVEGSTGPRLIPQGGLVDCLSVYGSKDRVDANTAVPAVLATAGLSPYAINLLLDRRRVAPLNQQQLADFLKAVGANPDKLRVEGNSIVTFRATARLRLPNGQLSDLKRTVAAQVKYMSQGIVPPVNILRWYDAAWSN